MFNIILVVFIFLLVSCQSGERREAITADEFQRLIEGEGWTTIVETEGLFNPTIDLVVIATKNLDGFWIELYEFPSESYAQSFFQGAQQRWEDFPDLQLLSSESGRNFERLELIADTRFVYLYQVDNIVLMSVTADIYQNIIQEIVSVIEGN